MSHVFLVIYDLLEQAENKTVAGLASFGVLLGIPILGIADDAVTKYGVYAMVGVCASVATAFWKSRGGIIKAMSEAKVSEAAVIENTTKETFARIERANNLVIERLERDLEYARERADTAEQIQHEITVAKHTAVEETFALAMHVRELEEIMKGHGIEFPKAPQVTTGRAVRAADATTAALLAKRAESVKSSKQTQPINATPL